MTSDPKVRFWFATGGAGFCISRALALRMSPVAGGGKLISIGDRIRFPDDVTVGFIIGEKLNLLSRLTSLIYEYIYRTFARGAVNGSRSISFPSGTHGTHWLRHISRSSKFIYAQI